MLVVYAAVRNFFGRNGQQDQRKQTTGQLFEELYEFMEQDEQLNWYKHLVKMLIEQHLRAQADQQCSQFKTEMPKLIGIMRDEKVDPVSLEQLELLLNNILKEGIHSE